MLLEKVRVLIHLNEVEAIQPHPKITKPKIDFEVAEIFEGSINYGSISEPIFGISQNQVLLIPGNSRDIFGSFRDGSEWMWQLLPEALQRS